MPFWGDSVLLHKRVPASVEAGVIAITILVALIIGILILTSVKGTIVNVATQMNDTDAINLVNSVFNTGKAGIIMLALSTLTLGAGVIIAYLRGMGASK